MMLLFIILILILILFYLIIINNNETFNNNEIFNNNETFNNNNNINIEYYVIHLKRNEERIENILLNEKILNHKIIIFDAIDGKQMNDLPYYDTKLINTFTNALPGELGCYLSHLMIIKNIQINNNYTVIFEDDLQIVTNDLNKSIIEIIDKLNDNFDIIYFGNTSNNCGEKYIDDIHKIDPNNHLWGTHGYIINNKNVKKIYDNLLIMNEPYDVKLKNLIDKQILKSYIINPPLVNQTSYIIGSTTRT